MDQARRNGAWEIVLVVLRSPSTEQSDRCAKLFLLWLATTGGAIALFVLASYVLGSVSAAVLLVVGSWFTCYYISAALEPQLLPEAALHVAVPVGQPQMLVNGEGLRQDDIEAIPAYEYHRKAGMAAEQCAVCINVVRDGETVRRLPAYGHAFHAPCVDGWLRAHATCPMCCADVKVAGEPQTEASV